MYWVFINSSTEILHWLLFFHIRDFRKYVEIFSSILIRVTYKSCSWNNTQYKFNNIDKNILNLLDFIIYKCFKKTLLYFSAENLSGTSTNGQQNIND